MREKDRMICPLCKAEMNFHAVKVDYTRVRQCGPRTNEEYGGILEEFHSCPRCGTTAERELVETAQ